MYGMFSFIGYWVRLFFSMNAHTDSILDSSFCMPHPNQIL